MNNEVYKASITVTNHSPGYLLFLPWWDSHGGTISFGEEAITLTNKSLAMGHQQVVVPYSDIDSYSKNGWTIYLAHHNTQYPKLLWIASSSRKYGQNNLTNIENSLIAHGVKQSEEVATNSRNSANKTLLFASIFAVCLMLILVIIAAIVKRK